MAKSKSKRSVSSARPAAESAAAASMLARACELFTAAEKRVFDSSLGHQLTKATHEQVLVASRQARALRDKWHALTSKQQRANKRLAAARTDVAAGRSREKLDLFQGVVLRLERRLAELSSGVSQAVASLAGRGRKPVRLKVDPGQKGRGKKIVTRAARRTAGKPVAPARPSVAGAIRAITAAANPPAAPAPKPAAKTTAAERTVSKKVRNAGKRAQLTALAGNQAIQFDKSKQRSATAAAKARRLAVQGLDTRRSGHAAARVRMKQARRDQRSR